MVRRRVMFSVVVSQIDDAWCPKDTELALLRSVLEPIETHVDCSGSTLFDSAVEDAVCSAVVSSECSGGLGMAKLF